MTKAPQPTPMSAGRRIYNSLFWIIIYLVGMVIGSALAWLVGAGLDEQIGAGFLGGFVLLFITNRWVRRVKSRPN